jgi:hypothetical protein
MVGQDSSIRSETRNMNHLARSRIMSVALVLLGIASAAQAEGKKKTPRRFGFDVDETTFPQKSPAEAMNSIAAALGRKKVDYLLAHLADPSYVDYWVDRYKVDFPQGKEEGRHLLAFDRLVRETNRYFEDDPLVVKDLRIFAKEAKWAEEGELATGTVDTIPARKVFLRKIGERWFLENKQQ